MAKIHEIHQALYTTDKRYVYECGGRGSGKSFAITDYCLRITYDTGRVIIFLRYTMIAASISIIPEFVAAMEREGVEDHFTITGSEITNNLTGSKIIFKGVKTSSLNQTANLKSIQGLTDVIYDEFEEHPDKETFDKLDESIREVGVKNTIVLSSNALHKKSWQYLEFFESTGLYYDMTEHIRTNYLEHNIQNLSESWLKKVNKVKEVDPAKYARDFAGEHYDDIEGALWRSDMIQRVEEAPQMKKIVVAIDPAVTNKEESDETGIIVVGIGYDNKYYVISDKSGKYSPREWAYKACQEYDFHSADYIVGEVNQGGDLIKSNIHTIDRTAAYKEVRATRGKAVRAEPVVSLYEQGLVYHVGNLSKLEVEMTSWNPMKDDWSPNRVDALVWGLTSIGVKQKEGTVV